MIVNYQDNYKYHKTFNNFISAFMIYEILNDECNIIEHYDKNYNRTVVWKKEYENIGVDQFNSFKIQNNTYLQ